MERYNVIVTSIFPQPSGFGTARTVINPRPLSIEAASDLATECRKQGAVVTLEAVRTGFAAEPQSLLTAALNFYRLGGSSRLVKPWEGEVKLIIFIAVIVVVALVANRFRWGYDDTDNRKPGEFFGKRSGLTLYTDHLTGVQYVKGGLFGGMHPRLDKDGKPMVAVRP